MKNQRLGEGGREAWHTLLTSARFRTQSATSCGCFFKGEAIVNYQKTGENAPSICSRKEARTRSAASAKSRAKQSTGQQASSAAHAASVASGLRRVKQELGGGAGRRTR